MRIISGKYKAKKLSFPQKQTIRPTADIVKQAMFTTLFDRVEDCVFLDLFCGSGQVGIEAASRGAKKVVFVDNDVDALNVTKKNLKDIEGNFECHKMHYAPFLRQSTDKFDIIFVDPPYESDYYKEVLNLIEKYDILNENGIIICEHNNNFSVQHNNYQLLQQKKYGIKALTYLIKKWVFFDKLFL